MHGDDEYLRHESLGLYIAFIMNFFDKNIALVMQYMEPVNG